MGECPAPLRVGCPVCQHLLKHEEPLSTAALYCSVCCSAHMPLPTCSAHCICLCTGLLRAAAVRDALSCLACVSLPDVRRT